ncbi:MAG: hydroxymyristoyl-ACP dehydratase [Marinilabiliaceae bacterium]|nr:hydroxymyristoyl-ACP dehydratase [Marinilabiliaceae bacterium]
MIEGKEILNYIPQRMPIVMIDRFHGLQDSETSASGLLVTDENLFVQNGKFQDSGIIEHIAQSCAMHLGYESVSRGEPVPLGFIGSVNKLEIKRLPLVGEELYTDVHFELRMGAVTQAIVVVNSGSEVIAQCKIKVAIV